MYILPWFLSKTANPTRIVAEIRRRQTELHHLEPAEKFITYNSDTASANQRDDSGATDIITLGITTKGNIDWSVGALNLTGKSLQRNKCKWHG